MAILHEEWRKSQGEENKHLKLQGLQKSVALVNFLIMNVTFLTLIEHHSKFHEFWNMTENAMHQHNLWKLLVQRLPQKCNKKAIAIARVCDSFMYAQPYHLLKELHTEILHFFILLSDLPVIIIFNNMENTNKGKKCHDSPWSLCILQIYTNHCKWFSLFNMLILHD